MRCAKWSSLYIGFYRTMHAAGYTAIVSCLSVCPSVCDVGDLWSYIVGSSKVITRIISLQSSLLAPQYQRSSTRGTSPKLGWNRGEVAVLAKKPAISLKGRKIGQDRFAVILIVSRIRTFDWRQNQGTWMILNKNNKLETRFIGQFLPLIVLPNPRSATVIWKRCYWPHNFYWLWK